MSGPNMAEIGALVKNAVERTGVLDIAVNGQKVVDFFSAANGIFHSHFFNPDIQTMLERTITDSVNLLWTQKEVSLNNSSEIKYNMLWKEFMNILIPRLKMEFNEYSVKKFSELESLKNKATKEYESNNAICKKNSEADIVNSQAAEISKFNFNKTLGKIEQINTPFRSMVVDAGCSILANKKQKHEFERNSSIGKKLCNMESCSITSQQPNVQKKREEKSGNFLNTAHSALDLIISESIGEKLMPNLEKKIDKGKNWLANNGPIISLIVSSSNSEAIGGVVREASTALKNGMEKTDELLSKIFSQRDEFLSWMEIDLNNHTSKFENKLREMNWAGLEKGGTQKWTESDLKDLMLRKQKAFDILRNMFWWNVPLKA